MFKVVYDDNSEVFDVVSNIEDVVAFRMEGYTYFMTCDVEYVMSVLVVGLNNNHLYKDVSLTTRVKETLSKLWFEADDNTRRIVKEVMQCELDPVTFSSLFGTRNEVREDEITSGSELYYYSKNLKQRVQSLEHILTDADDATNYMYINGIGCDDDLFKRFSQDVEFLMRYAYATEWRLPREYEDLIFRTPTALVCYYSKLIYVYRPPEFDFSEIEEAIKNDSDAIILLAQFLKSGFNSSFLYECIIRLMYHVKPIDLVTFMRNTWKDDRIISYIRNTADIATIEFYVDSFPNDTYFKTSVYSRLSDMDLRHLYSRSSTIRYSLPNPIHFVKSPRVVLDILKVYPRGIDDGIAYSLAKSKHVALEYVEYFNTKVPLFEQLFSDDQDWMCVYNDVFKGVD